MDKYKEIATRATEEVLQIEGSKSKILYEILFSKRLLVEHVEILEECLYDIESVEGCQEKQFLNPLCATLSLVTSGIMLSMGRKCFYVLPVLSSIYSGIYLGKVFRTHRINRNRAFLQNLLKSIENFENIIKKHILFFNELQRFKTKTHVSNDGDFVSTCIQCLKDVILVIYDGIKELESEYQISKKYELVYEPIEDLCQTEYFIKSLDEFSSKNIKEFLNLFLFVQSQYLLRLGLIVATGDCDSDFIKYNTMNLSPLIDEQTTNCSYNFDLIMFVASPDKENHSFKKVNERNQTPMDLLRAKSYSMSFVPKLLAVTHECVRLESALNNIIDNYDETDKEQDDMHDLLPIMSQIDSELLMCQDEYQRLVITIQKFLNIAPVEKLNEIEDKAFIDEEKAENKFEHDPRKVGESVFGYHDDFFALDGMEDDEDLNEEKSKTLDQEDDHINRKIVKRTFKPVLKQLKSKIEPLATQMKEREKKVLTEKGIEVQDLQKSIGSTSDGSLSDSDDEEKLRRKRENKSAQKYSEMREFLEQKQQLNLFGLKTPVASLVQEDVIE
uniref:CSON010353 protein n=1 Tax=Culicoides sonorensis TaxID=179676 RepID=A0A336KFX7_CULSO